jgi:hypothetical protein
MSNYNPPVVSGYNMPAQDSTTVQQLSVPLYQARGWLKFLGIMSIISGASQVLSIVGIFSGALSIWLGVLLNQAGSNIQAAAQTGDRYSFSNSLGSLKTYFMIRGILTLISLITGALALCVLVVLPLLGVSFLVDPDVINNIIQQITSYLNL